MRRTMPKREIAISSGRGAWYARNINRSLKKILYTVVHFVSTILTAILVLLVLAPSDHSYTLDLGIDALIMFIFMGLFTGIMIID